VRRRLYFLHEYNCQVAKVTKKYPRSRKFDLLLVKYIELEFEALYFKNPHPSKQLQETIELRVLRFLHVMLYQAVLNNETLGNENTDTLLKRAILGLLGQVKSQYLVEDKLVCNISKLLKKINGRRNSFNSRNSSFWEIHRNLATSDYGTDDSDSDFEHDIFCKNVFQNKSSLAENTNTTTSDCVEVPLISNGVSPIPTIEFADDDDDNYFVYLQRHVTTKRKIKDDCRAVTKRNLLDPVSNNVSNKTNLSLDGNLDSKKKCINHRCEPSAIPKTENNESCVIICSDSEDENSTETLNQDKTSKKQNLHKKNGGCNKESRVNKNIGVITFEILDDDDDDNENGDLNYMISLQKEVETNKKIKKQGESDCKAIIICSDSEDDLVVEKLSKQKCNKDTGQLIKATAETGNTACVKKIEHSFLPKVISSIDMVPHTKNKSETICKNNGVTCSEETLDDILSFVDTLPSQNNTQNCTAIVCNEPVEIKESCSGTSKETSDKVEVESKKFLIVEKTLNQQIDNQPSSVKIDIYKQCKNQVTSSLPQENSDFLVFESAAAISEDAKTNFLINPAIIFEQTQLSKTEELALTKLGNVQNGNVNEAVATNYEEVIVDKTNVLGGPVLSEKVNSFEDLDNLQECRINESLLDELLLDDSYLLEGRKEFEELEYFLFNDNIEKPGFYFSNFQFDENETVLQPETFDADMKSLESLLDDSHLFTLAESEIGYNSFANNNKVDKCAEKNKKPSDNVNCDPLKDSTNQNCKVKEGSSAKSTNSSSKKNAKSIACRRGKNFRAIFKQSKKVNKR
jgi:hypothetical protein